MRNERAGNPLKTTAVVNEAYLRSIDVHNIGCLEDAARFGQGGWPGEARQSLHARNLDQIADRDTKRNWRGTVRDPHENGLLPTLSWIVERSKISGPEPLQPAGCRDALFSSGAAMAGDS
jgi:hypothetical protein